MAVSEFQYFYETLGNELRGYDLEFFTGQMFTQTCLLSDD